MARIGVIVNPHASGSRRPGRVKALVSAVGELGTVVVTRDLEAMHVAMERFAEQGVEVLAICGGDGSVGAAVSHAIDVFGVDHMPKVLALRGGTINNIARSIAPAGRPERVLARVASVLGAGGTLASTERNLVLVNGTRRGAIFGAGLITHFLELYYEGRRPGPLRAAWLLVLLGCSWLVGGRRIAQVVPHTEAQVTADGVELEFATYTIILAAVVESIGLGVRPFYHAGAARGFHVLAGDPSAGSLLGRLGHFAWGFPPRLDTLYDGAARKMEIRFRTPQRYTIDGDLFGPEDHLVLECGPRVSFITDPGHQAGREAPEGRTS